MQPDDVPQIAAKLKIEEKKLKEALSSMTKSRRIIKVREDYYIHPEILENAKDTVVKFFERKPVLTPQDARDILGLSRKFMISLLEYLDGIKFTICVQEGRKLRKQ